MTLNSTGPGNAEMEMSEREKLALDDHRETIALHVRMATLERDMGHIDTRFSEQDTKFSEIGRKIDTLMNMINQQTRTPTTTIIGVVTIVLAAVGILGTLYITPVKQDVDYLKLHFMTRSEIEKHENEQDRRLTEHQRHDSELERRLYEEKQHLLEELRKELRDRR